jgi:long-chain fatty acid transport protein
MSRMLRPRTLVLGALLVLATGAAARANDLDEFGFGARPGAMASAYTALAGDWTAPYYNPAGVAVCRSLSLGIGYSYASYDVKFKSQVGGDQDRQASRVDPLSAVSGGMASTLGPPDTLMNRIGVGFALFFPTRHTLAVDWESSPGEPQYFLYGPRQDRMMMLPAAAFRIPLPGLEPEQTLAVGVGGNILVNVRGTQTFDLGTSTPSAVRTTVEANYDIAPNAGLYYIPADWLSFGVCYRGELSLGSKIGVDIDLAGNGTAAFPLDLEAVSFFQPQQVQGGFAVDPAEGLTLALDVTWKNWSAFHDPFLTIGTIIGQTDPHFRDTVTPRLGAEYEVTRGLAIRGGYHFQPSPIPDQKGPTNLVDLDEHVFSLGLGWTYWTTRAIEEKKDGRSSGLRPAEEAPHEEPYRPISIDAFFQWHHLAGVRVEKDDPASSGGAGAFYEASGEVFDVGITLTVRI